MDEITLILNETIKSASQLSVTLTMRHDSLNSRKQLKLNLVKKDELNLAKEKCKLSYQNKKKRRVDPLQGRTYKPHQQKNKFPFGSLKL